MWDGRETPVVLRVMLWCCRSPTLEKLPTGVDRATWCFRPELAGGLGRGLVGWIACPVRGRLRHRGAGSPVCGPPSRIFADRCQGRGARLADRGDPGERGRGRRPDGIGDEQRLADGNDLSQRQVLGPVGHYRPDRCATTVERHRLAAGGAPQGLCTGRRRCGVPGQQLDRRLLRRRQVRKPERDPALDGEGPRDDNAAHGGLRRWRRSSADGEGRLAQIPPSPLLICCTGPVRSGRASRSPTAWTTWAERRSPKTATAASG